MKLYSIPKCATAVALALCGCDRTSSSTSGTKPILNVIHLETTVTMPQPVNPNTARRDTTPTPRKGAPTCP